MELYQRMNFDQNPFSTFSAEEESVFLDKIFVKPLYYNSLISDISSGHSRFILGARGIGKTALIFRLKNELDERGQFSCIVDKYDGVAERNNKADFIKHIIQAMTKDYSLFLVKNPKSIKGLDDIQKEKLAFIIKLFFRTVSRKELERYYNWPTKFKSKNLFRNIYNNFLNRPINILISGTVEIASDAIRKALGLPSPSTTDFYKAYLPEVDLEGIKAESTSNELLRDESALKSVLKDLADIINESGFGRPVVFFDKIDEFDRLNSNIGKISDFVIGPLQDTSLLLDDEFALVFSLWDAVKPELSSRGARFDKIKPLDITWNDSHLKEILEKRLSFFSAGKVKYDSVIENVEDYASIIKLSNRSPRYLFRLLSTIYDQQNTRNPDSEIFERRNIDQGMREFSTNFDFYTVYPGNRGNKQDIITNINRLLRIGKSQIRTKDFVETFRVSTPTAISYIKIVRDYNLVTEDSETDNGAKLYNVNNPVVLNLIQNGVKELRR